MAKRITLEQFIERLNKVLGTPSSVSLERFAEAISKLDEEIKSQLVEVEPADDDAQNDANVPEDVQAEDNDELETAIEEEQVAEEQEELDIEIPDEILERFGDIPGPKRWDPANKLIFFIEDGQVYMAPDNDPDKKELVVDDNIIAALNFETS